MDLSKKRPQPKKELMKPQKYLKILEKEGIKC